MDVHSKIGSIRTLDNWDHYSKLAGVLKICLSGPSPHIMGKEIGGNSQT